MTTILNRLRSKQALLLAVFLLLFWAAMLIDLEHVPAPWFEEAWNLLTVRQWVQHGVYGRLLEGQFISSRGITHSVAVLAWQALSSLIFQPGVWQGRLPSTIFMTLSLLLIYLLANRMYGKPVGGWSLAILMVLSLPGIHPYWYGRQAVSEAPCVFFILAGYWVLSKPDARIGEHLFVSLFWGLAMSVRGVAIPFLSAALIFPAIVAGFRKVGGVVRKYTLTWVGSLAVYVALYSIERWLGRGLFEYGLMQGSERTWFFVTEPQVRLETLTLFTTIGLFSILGIGYAIRLNWREIFAPKENQGALSYIRLSWFTLVLSWLVWYLLLSVGWLRHYLPAFYLSSIYQALLLLRAIAYVQNIKKRLLRISYAALGCLVFLLFAALNVFSLVQQFQDRDDTLLIAVDYLNEQTAPDALIEAYAPEIFIYLERDYHYPPDQVQLVLNRRAYLHQDIEINYDPLSANPDYIVIESLERFWGLYTDVVTTDQFNLVYENQEFQIYQQVGAVGDK